MTLETIIFLILSPENELLMSDDILPELHSMGSIFEEISAHNKLSELQYVTSVFDDRQVDISWNSNGASTLDVSCDMSMDVVDRTRDVDNMSTVVGDVSQHRLDALHCPADTSCEEVDVDLSYSRRDVSSASSNGSDTDTASDSEQQRWGHSTLTLTALSLSLCAHCHFVHIFVSNEK